MNNNEEQTRPRSARHAHASQDAQPGNVDPPGGNQSRARLFTAYEELLMAHQNLEARLVENVQEFRQTIRQLLDMTRRLHLAREKDAARISHEIHDRLGQSLVALKLQLQSANRPAGNGAPEMRQQNTDALSMLDDAIASLRRIADALHPSLLDQLGLVDALSWLCLDLQEKTGLRCAFQLLGDPVPISSPRASLVFRIVQDLLISATAAEAAVTVQVDTRARLPLVLLHVERRGALESAPSDVPPIPLAAVRPLVSMAGGSIRERAAGTSDPCVTIRLPLCRDGDDDRR